MMSQVSADKSSELDEFIALSRRAKREFSFLSDYGFILLKQTLPRSLDFRDGFIFNYHRLLGYLVYPLVPALKLLRKLQTKPGISVDVEYYDMEFSVIFTRRGVRAPYLFIDKKLFGNRSGYHGNMFPRNKLEKVILATAADIRENYQQILRGDQQTWEKIEKLLTAPEPKRRLPP